MPSQTVVLTGVGLSPPLQLQNPLRSAPESVILVGQLQPLLIVNLSTGSILDYNIEITGVQSGYTTQGGYPSGEPWNAADNGAGLTANINYGVDSMVIAFRINVKTYSTGTLTASLVQP